MSLHLPVIDAGSVKALTDRFRCEPFHVVLSAQACIARRGATYEAGRNSHAGPAQKTAHPTCAGCSVGAAIAKQVAPAPKRRKAAAR